MLRSILAATVIVGILATGQALAFEGETTVTGVVSNVDPQLRLATITPANGAPIRVHFDWIVGGPCSICLGGGLKGPTFDDTIKNGSTWTVVYTTSYPDGKVYTVNRVLQPNGPDTGQREGN